MYYIYTILTKYLNYKYKTLRRRFLNSNHKSLNMFPKVWNYLNTFVILNNELF